MTSLSHETSWKFAGFSHDGQRLSGEISASSKEDAHSILKQRGLVPHKLAPARTRKWAKWQRQEKLTAVDLHELIRDLAALLSARLPIDEALATLEHLSQSKRRRNAIRSLRTSVSNGQGLADAMTRLPAMPGFAIGMTRAGEVSGDLGRALDRLAQTMAKTLALRHTLQSALVYPIILLAVTALSLFVILTVVVPNLKPLLEGSSDTPLSAAILVAASDLLTQSYDLIALSLAAIFVGFLLWLRRKGAAAIVDRRSLDLPIVGPLMRKGETALVCRTLGILLEAGSPLPTALEISASAARNQAIAASLATAKDRVREGANLGPTLRSLSVLAPAAAQFASVGERTGRLSDMLLVGAEGLERDTERTAKRLVTLISPLMTIALGGGVALVVMTILSAILSVNDLAF